MTTVLAVDNYAGGFIRIQAGSIEVTGETATVALATSPGPGGAVYPTLGDIPGHDVVWADFGGNLGKARTQAGDDVMGSTLKEWIRRGTILTVYKDDTDSAHPALVVEETTEPPAPPAPSTPTAALSTQIRDDLVIALSAAVPVPVYPHVPKLMTFPCVTLVPDSPYLRNVTLGPGIAYEARFRVVVLAQALDNLAGVTAVEDLVDQVIAALPPGAEWSECTPITLQDLGSQGSAYAAELTVSRPAREVTP